MALLSIIVPVYNKEMYIDDCIKSILSQTFTDFELILVNDGSTDGSGSKCDIYEKSDPRILVFHQKNQGVSAARNKGITEASGKFIGFIDSDDTIERNMYKILIGNALENDADISICGLNQFNSKRTLKGQNSCQRAQILNREDVLTAFFNEELDFSANNKIYSTSIAKKIKFEGKVFEDAFYTFQAFLLSRKNVFIREKLYNYITRENSVSISSFNPNYMDTVKVTKAMVQIVSEKFPNHLESAKILDFIMHLSLVNLILYFKLKDKYWKEYEEVTKHLLGLSNFIRSTKRISAKHLGAFWLFKLDATVYSMALKTYCSIFPSHIEKKNS